MHFYLTSFLHPLEEPMRVSNYLDFTFDNPRTSEEIALVARCIEVSYSCNSGFNIPLYFDDTVSSEQYFSIESVFKKLFNETDDDYLLSISEHYDRESPFEAMARLWVIVRFDDEGSYQKLVEHHNQLPDDIKGKCITLLEDEHPLVRNGNLVYSYAYILSLLSHPDLSRDYCGNSFIAATYDEIRGGFPIQHIPRYFLYYSLSLSKTNIKHDDEPKLFPSSLNRIMHFANKLDVLLSNKLEKEKIEHISSLLKAAGKEVENENHRLVVLVSIIELLLTHNPDNTRFNVEDSIGKQFQLKASILVYANNKQKNINEIQKRLKIIYGQRSNIAHGNFIALNKFRNNLCKKEGKEEYFEDLILDLYDYIKAILLQYIDDPEYVNFLKEH